MANTIINANGTLVIKGNAIVDATGALKLPEGSTAERPSPGANGYIRYNATSDSFEGYTGAGWGSLGGGGGLGTVTSVGSGAGLTGGPITSSGTLAVGAGDGITVNTNNVAIDTTWFDNRVSTLLPPGGSGLSVLDETTALTASATSIAFVGTGVTATGGVGGVVTVTIAGGGTGDITGVTAGSGLTDGGTTGTVTLNVGAGDGIEVNADNVAINTSWFDNRVSTLLPPGGSGLSVLDETTALTASATSISFVGTGVTATGGVGGAVTVTIAGGGTGDITGVTAGAGLTGGGVTGAVTVAVGAGDGITVNADNVAINTAWLSGYIGTTATGDITGVTAGAGLTGGGTTGAVTVAVGEGDGITVNADNVAINTAWFDNRVSTLLPPGGSGLSVLDETTALTASATSISFVGTGVTATGGVGGAVTVTIAGGGTGDISGVTAGAGLTGGGTTGAVTVAVGAGDGITVNADNVAINTAWLSGYIGTTATGDITGVTAGAGLTGGGVTGAVTVAVGAGDGITVNADNVALASTTAGNGLTYTTGVLAVGAGSGITVNAGDVALATTTAGAGLTYTTGVLAVGDGDGITINADNVAVDSTVVRTTGDQSIAGVKTFTSNTSMSNVTVNGYVTTPLKVNNQGVASEGGQIELRKPSSGSLLSGDLAIDLFGNTIRIFDNASTFRGMFANIAACASGPASEIVHSTNYSIFFDQELSGTAGDGLTYTTGVLDVDGTVVRTSGNQSIAGVKTFTGDIQVNARYIGDVTASSTPTTTTRTVNCSLGNYFTATVSAATNTTFTFSNPPAGAYSFTLKVTHSSGAGTITWPLEVIWPGDVAPAIPPLITGKTHIFIFETSDSGTNWYGTSLINYTP